MSTKQNQVPQNTEKLKEIPKWTRKYAQNRTLTTFVILVMICLMSMVIGVPLALAMMAFSISCHIDISYYPCFKIWRQKPRPDRPTDR